MDGTELQVDDLGVGVGDSELFGEVSCGQSQLVLCWLKVK